MEPGTVVVRVVSFTGEARATLANGENLLAGLSQAGIRVAHRCRQARCGRCRATVRAGGELLAPPGAQERLRLGSFTGQQRLLCQATVRLLPSCATGEIVLEP